MAMSAQIPTLLFVYNASSDPVSVVMDFAHKIASPSTYQCRLCALTYGNFTMKKDWKKFIQSLNFPVEFEHKDGAARKYPGLRADSLPAAYLVERDKSLKPFISSEEMNTLTDLEELEKLVRTKLGQLGR